MAIDERARHQLYLRLEEQIGAEAASTLMEHLPPTGWADVATKRDLEHLAAISRSELDRTAAELGKAIESSRADLHKTIATHTVAIVFAVMASNAAAVYAVAQFR